MKSSALNISTQGVGALESVLACPKCQGKVSFQQEQLQCKKCKTSFKSITGIPWFFEHADRLFWDWKYQIDHFLKSLGLEQLELEQELRTPGLLEETKKRLSLLKVAKAQVRDHYQRLFSAFQSLSLHPIPWQSVPQTKLPLGTTLGSYSTNIFRDWAWGEEENKKSFSLVQKALPLDLSSKKVLVLGAGSGRLSYDLHETLQPELTVAVDYHPLHLLTAKALLNGENLSVYEFPLSPKDSSRAALLRTLKAPKAASPSLHLLFADGTNPPFEKNTFDVVLTPWFIDVVPSEFSVLLNRIQQVLKVGGSWVHFGPLGFSSKPFSKSYCVDEIVALTKTAGFEIKHHTSEVIPYLKCPDSMHSRMETVQVLSAGKKIEMAPLKATPYLPGFLTNLNEPVPLAREFFQTAESAKSALTFISFIDGKRSINQIVEAIVSKTQLPEDQTRAALVHFLTFLYEQEKNQRY